MNNIDLPQRIAVVTGGAYPPDLEQEAVQTVLAQAEVMLREVAASTN